MTDTVQVGVRTRPSYALKDIDWGGVRMLTSLHVFCVVGVVYAVWGNVNPSFLADIPVLGGVAGPVSWATYLFAVCYFFLCHIAIGLGAHKLYAHTTKVEVHPAVHYVLVVLFSGVLQGPVVWWSSKHRLHHAKTDTPEDPHSRVLGGFFHAHMGWLITKVGTAAPHPRYMHHFIKRRDEKYRAVWWQLRSYRWLGPLMAFGLPTAVCSMWGDPLGGLLVGGAIRLVVQYHATWSINSCTHRGTLDDHSSSARNVPALVLVTVGEGYHKYHHDHPMSWRMGRWDVTAFVVMALAWCGLATIEEPDSRLWEKEVS